LATSAVPLRDVSRGEHFDFEGVAFSDGEFPDLGCNARCDIEDDVRLNFRGVEGTVALAV
jgi:hypothetical protein